MSKCRQRLSRRVWERSYLRDKDKLNTTSSGYQSKIWCLIHSSSQGRFGVSVRWNRQKQRERAGYKGTGHQLRFTLEMKHSEDSGGLGGESGWWPGGCLSALLHSGLRAEDAAFSLEECLDQWRKGQLLKKSEAELEKTKRSDCDGQTGGSGGHHQHGEGSCGALRVQWPAWSFMNSADTSHPRACKNAERS